jgi:hypothetical protein
MNTTLKQAYAVLTAVAVLVAVTATSAFGSTGGAIVAEGARVGHKPKRISASSAFVLPSAQQCVNGRELMIELRKLPHIKWIAATVDINGKPFETIKRSALTRSVTLTGLPSTRFVLSIEAKTSNGRSATATLDYRTCIAPPKPVPPKPPFPCCSPVPPAPVPPVPVTPEEKHVTPEEKSVTPKAILPGSYSGTHTGSGSYSDAMTLYVNPESTSIQDVEMPYVELPCTPSGSGYYEFHVAEIPINADGSFTSSTSEERVVEGAMATVTYTFSGTTTEGAASGSFREDLAYDNGTSYSCTSGTDTWTVERDASQGSQAKAAPPAGSYSGTHTGSGSYSDAVTFYVNPEETAIQDVEMPYVDVPCSPSGGEYYEFHVAEIPINADGSFTSSTSEERVVAGAEAKVTYTFDGHLHGFSSSAQERIAGSFREDLTYNNGTSYSCTSGTDTWTVERDASQGNQAKAAPPAGSYSGTHTGSNPYSDALTFYVNPEETEIQDVEMPYVDVPCSPSGGEYYEFHVAEIPINADGSFTSSTSEERVVAGAEAKVTYTFDGHLHGFSSSAQERIAGSFREDLTYNNGTSYSCTSGTDTWTVQRDASQGNQVKAAPPAGSYSGTHTDNNPYSDALTFTVPGGGGALESVVMPYVYIPCAPSKDYYEEFHLSDVPIEADGTLSASASENRVIEGGVSAEITYEMNGHLHGYDSDGKERISGSFRESMTFTTGGKSYSCTSGTDTWTALN